MLFGSLRPILQSGPGISDPKVDDAWRAGLGNYTDGNKRCQNQGIQPLHSWPGIQGYPNARLSRRTTMWEPGIMGYHGDISGTGNSDLNTFCPVCLAGP